MIRRSFLKRLAGGVAAAVALPHVEGRPDPEPPKEPKQEHPPWPEKPKPAPDVEAEVVACVRELPASAFSRTLYGDGSYNHPSWCFEVDLPCGQGRGTFLLTQIEVETESLCRYSHRNGRAHREPPIPVERWMHVTGIQIEGVKGHYLKDAVVEHYSVRMPG